MTTDDSPPWEPPLAGTEVEHLLGALDRLRATLRWKADGLDADGLRAQIPSSQLSLGGLLKHLAFVEDLTFTWKLSASDPGDPWRAIDWDANPGWDFASAADDTPEELYALWDGAVARSRERVGAALAAGGLDTEADVANDAGVHASLR